MNTRVVRLQPHLYRSVVGQFGMVKTSSDENQAESLSLNSGKSIPFKKVYIYIFFYVLE